MKKRIIIPAAIFAIFLVGFFIVKGNQSEEGTDVIVSVEQGTFKVEIETTGELEAKSSVPITGPRSLRNFRIYNLSIQKLIDEGTVVKKGDWIATLDKSEFQGRLEDSKLNLDEERSEYTQVQLDTTLEMRQSRDELINLEYAVEEREIILEQSQFEPPATIKQAEIEVAKAKRALSQAKENYKIKRRRASEQMKEQAADLNKERREYQEMLKLEQEFTIRAPEPGMVIYKKGRDGKAIKEGSQISVWDPTVATLPDLSVMLSKTYVNEVDVRKVKAGQSVEIGLDAFPDKKLTGRVIKVANVGEQRPNSDAKVFEVSVEINEADESLRPAMTTSNKIIALVLDSVKYVPLETLHSHNDSIAYVFKSTGIGVEKQEVLVGAKNSDAAVIELGLEADDKIYLSVPKGMEDKSIALLPELDGKRNQEEEVKETPKKEMDARNWQGRRGGRSTR